MNFKLIFSLFLFFYICNSIEIIPVDENNQPIKYYQDLLQNKYLLKLKRSVNVLYNDVINENILLPYNVSYIYKGIETYLHKVCKLNKYNDIDCNIKGYLYTNRTNYYAIGCQNCIIYYKTPNLINFKYMINILYRVIKNKQLIQPHNNILERIINKYLTETCVINYKLQTKKKCIFKKASYRHKLCLLTLKCKNSYKSSGIKFINFKKNEK